MNTNLLIPLVVVVVIVAIVAIVLTQKSRTTNGLQLRAQSRLPSEASDPSCLAQGLPLEEHSGPCCVPTTSMTRFGASSRRP